MNTNTSRLTHRSQNKVGMTVDSLDNGSNVTQRYDRKKLKEMRKELILIFRFFCLDKDFIAEMLRGKAGFGVAPEGSVRFAET